MRRKCTDSLIQWKKSSSRKPLILQGLRQTGKTWLLLDFGNKQYENTLYVNLETDKPAADYLSTPHDPQEALLFLEAYTDKPLRPSASLLVLDNLQCVPQISTLLINIALDFPQYHIAAIKKGVYPDPDYTLNDFDILTLYPMDFEEFLWANAEFALAREIYAHFSTFTSMGKELHTKAMSQFRLYQIIGGMPLSILEFKRTKSLLMIPDIQQKILDLYLADITASAPKGTTTHSRNSWLSIPSQLGKNSRKFQYTRIAKGATAKTYQEPLKWLIRSGLALTCPEYPGPSSSKLIPPNTFSSKAESETFSRLHLYPIDVGLCTRILKLPSYQLLSGEEGPSSTACAETFLAQQFTRNGYNLSYWHSQNQAEVPFLLEKSGQYIAVDYRLSPHQKCRNLMRLSNSINQGSICNNINCDNNAEKNSYAKNNHPKNNYTDNNSSKLQSILCKEMYLISSEDFKEKEHYRIMPFYAAFCI